VDHRPGGSSGRTPLEPSGTRLAPTAAEVTTAARARRDHPAGCPAITVPSNQADIPRSEGHPDAYAPRLLVSCIAGISPAPIPTRPLRRSSSRLVPWTPLQCLRAATADARPFSLPCFVKPEATDRLGSHRRARWSQPPSAIGDATASVRSRSLADAGAGRADDSYRVGAEVWGVWSYLEPRGGWRIAAYGSSARSAAWRPSVSSVGSRLPFVR